MVPEWIISLAFLCLHSCKELQNIPGFESQKSPEDGFYGDVTAAILATPYFAKHLHFLCTVPSLQSRGPQYFWHQEPLSWEGNFFHGMVSGRGGWFGGDSLKCATSFLAHAVLSGVCIPMRIYCHGLSDRRWSSGGKVSD